MNKSMTPEMALNEVSCQLNILHDLIQIAIELQDENAEALRIDGAGAGVISYYLKRSELADSLLCTIIEKVAAIEEMACYD